MSGTLQITTKVAYANGLLADAVASNTTTVVQNTAGILTETVTVTNTQSDVNTSVINTLGWVMIQHVGNTNANFLQYGPKNTNTNTMGAWGRLYQGEKAIFRAEPGTTIRWVANTNSVPVLLKIWND